MKNNKLLIIIIAVAVIAAFAFAIAEIRTDESKQPSVQNNTDSSSQPHSHDGGPVHTD